MVCRLGMMLNSNIYKLSFCANSVVQKTLVKMMNRNATLFILQRYALLMILSVFVSEKKGDRFAV